MAHVVKDTRAGYTFDIPRADLHDSVCVDVYDREVTRGYRQGETEKVLVWEVNQINPDFNAPFLVRQAYTPTLSEGSNLRRDLETWRNKAFIPDELDGFDLETLIGKPCTLEITHSEPYGKFKRVYANVSRVLPKKKGAKFAASGKYIRVDERTENTAQVTQNGSNSLPFEADDDLPF